ncbi:MAG TPA: molybdopterin-dependent oxidoreductase [Acidimicrobiales bacterium]|nr:molybdopterin-dependent oxidoreductase [Acidimicrobiales bacterium]
MNVAPGSGNQGGGRVAVGRRVFLGMVGLGAAGVVLGAPVQEAVVRAVGSRLAADLPGGDQFVIYSVTGEFPRIEPESYKLDVSGMVERPLRLSLADLLAMPSVQLVEEFQCVTGWRVPGVRWEGVRLATILDAAGVRSGAGALSFGSYDGLDTESLTLEQARLPDVIVAYRMLGAPITTEHGGPVRLYVAPMFGYKSLKWLSSIEVVRVARPGYWEQNGYPVNAWRDGSTSAAVPPAYRSG